MLDYLPLLGVSRIQTSDLRSAAREVFWVGMCTEELKYTHYHLLSQMHLVSFIIRGQKNQRLVAFSFSKCSFPKFIFSRCSVQAARVWRRARRNVPLKASDEVQLKPMHAPTLFIQLIGISSPFLFPFHLIPSAQRRYGGALRPHPKCRAPKHFSIWVL